jgi:SHS2 domain-containing protein
VPWETFEHQADLGLSVRAPTGGELFAEAGLAYFSLVCDLAAVEERERYELAGAAPAVEELLVDWLNDLVFLFEGRGVVCRRIELPSWSETAYSALLYGEPGDAGRHALRGVVKAATYHGVHVRHDAGGWHARVILDV